jgi:hypothetical protein
MMLPTHALVGLALGATVAAVAPEHAAAALAGAFAGSVLPDFDLYTGHRRRLHYPTGYAVAALPAGAAAVLLGAPELVAVAVLCVGAALHCRMDRYGGGLELRPWEGTSDRAVYDHARGRWLRPRRWVRYDGAPEDVLLAALVGLPLVVLFDGPVRWVAVAALLVGGTYGLLRRRLAALAPRVLAYVPGRIAARAPDRYRD